MITFNLFVFGTLIFVSLVSMILTHHYKSRLTGMTGMIIAMFAGMNIGLTSGVFLGTLYQGNLYLSTMIAVLIGAACGAACGMNLGTLSSIEGFMSGLMGGMMGAMLGEMITPQQSIVFINIFLTLSLSSLLLFKILPKQSAPYYSESLLKPILTFILLSVYLLYGSHLGKAWVDETTDTSENHEIHQHSDHGN